MSFLPIDFDSPRWLLALVPLLAVVIYFTLRSRAGLPPAVQRLALVLRCVAISALILALSRMVLLSGGDGVSLLVLRDLSASVPRLVSDEMIEQTSRRIGTLNFPDQVSLVSFGKEQQLEQPMAMRLGSGISADIDRSGSDIASALRFAASSLEGAAPGGFRRVVLISDGNSTEGDPLREAKNLASAGIAVDVLPVFYDHQKEIILENLEAPETVRPGQAYSVDSVIWSSDTTEATVVLSEGSEVIERRSVTLEPGRNRQVFPLVAGENALQRLSIAVEAADGVDSLKQNNFGDALVRTLQRPKVLVISNDDDQTLRQILVAGNIEVDQYTPQGMATSLEGFHGVEAVILDDVSAFDFLPQQIELLEKMVHTTGMGLLMVGGPSSFGAGGWRGTKVEDALPVKMNIEQRKKLPNGALAVVLHTCEFAQGNLWARRIAHASTEALTPQDLFGVLIYRGGVDLWGIPLAPLADSTVVSGQINSLVPEDMLTFGNSMTLAIQALVPANAYSKHLVVISDGDPTPPSQPLIDSYIANGIQVSTICINPHSGPAGTGTMKKIASQTGGRFYFVSDPAALPQIFFREALQVRKNLISEEEFTPLIVDVADPIRGLDGFPPLHGIVLTTVKPMSRLVLVNPDEDPVLALGRHGLGKTAAFTSDARSRWSADWQGWGGNSTFWTQLVRSITREVEESVLEISHTVEGDEGVVIVDAIDANGRFLDGLDLQGVLIGPDLTSSNIELNQQAPGRYIGRFPAGQEGSYLIRSNYDDGKGSSGGQTKVITVGYPAEYRVLSSNIELLRQITEVSGGRVLTDQDDLLDRSLPSRKDRKSLWQMLASIGLFLFFIDIVVRRVQFQMPGRTARPSAVEESVDGASDPAPRRTIAASRRETVALERDRSEQEGGAEEAEEQQQDESEDLKKLLRERRKRRKKGI